jgi:hypothetical protein
LSTSAYDRDYATCSRTWATLCIYDLDPALVTEALGLEPTSACVNGERWRTSRGWSRSSARRSSWRLTTRDVVSSRDSRAHLDWLLDRLEPLQEALERLRADGARIVISCFWGSLCGHGGPTLPARQMRRLADLKLELWFDVYFEGDEDGDPSPANERGNGATASGRKGDAGELEAR